MRKKVKVFKSKQRIKIVDGKPYDLDYCAGGMLNNNSNPKYKRPLTTKYAMHLVLRSTKARGKQGFFRHRQAIERILIRQSKRSGVKIYRYANVHNHLHIVIRPRSRSAYCRFIRAVTGLIARRVTNCGRGRPATEKGFWDLRPFTRVLSSWGHSFARLYKYIEKNWMESTGEIFLLHKMGYLHSPP